MKNKLPIAASTLKRVAGNIFYPVLALGIILAVWATAAAIKGNPLVLPMPGEVLESFFTLGASEGFWRAVGMSLLRTLICFMISLAAAAVLAVLAALWKPVHKTLAPVVGFLRAAPTVAVILVLYAFMPGRMLAVAVGFLIAFPLLYAELYAALAGVDPELAEMAKVYRVHRSDIVTHLYLPAAADSLLASGGAALSLTLKVVVAAEILTSVAGSIGSEIKQASQIFEVTELFAWTLVAIVFSLALEGVIALARSAARRRT